MYRYVILLLCLLTCCNTSPRSLKTYPDYSHVSETHIELVESTVISNLTVLGKVWGFVKYHHPVFAGDQYNIDYELFELLPEVIDAEKEERNRILLEWVNGFGKFKYNFDNYQEMLSEGEYIITTDCYWINDAGELGQELSEKLVKLRYAERESNIHISIAHPEEPKSRYSFLKLDSHTYRRTLLEDYKYRLLSLFKYWNVIEYYFPYRNITDKDWDGVLAEYIPRFLERLTSAYDESYSLTLASLIAQINDSHAWANLDYFFGIYKIPLDLCFAEGKLIVRDHLKYAELFDGGFKSGDEIISIEGRTPDELIELVETYISSSNAGRTLHEAEKYTTSTHSKNSVPIIFKRRDTIREVNLPVFNPGQLSMVASDKKTNEFRLLNDSVGYLYYPEPYDSIDMDGLKKDLHNTKVLIIDHRCYPLLTRDLFFDGFFTDEPVHITNLSIPIPEMPGYFSYEPIELHFPSEGAYKGRVIVLVNSQTMSAAEYTAMILQASNNAIVIGSQTAGADGNITSFLLPGSYDTTFSSLGVFYPDGTPTQRVGIRIDHYVEPTIQGIKEGRDEVLEYAMDLINSTIGFCD